MTAHAVLAPSSADVWGHCTGSVIAAAAVPSHDTEQTRDGIAAHWVCSTTLATWRQTGYADTRWMIGATNPETGVVIDAEIAEAAAVFVQDVIDTLGPIPGGREALLIEHRVHMPAIHPDCFGTLDAAAVVPGAVYLWDYKHGHAKVDVVDNRQLVCYLEGLREQYNIDGMASQYTRVSARIVQPLAYDPSGPVSTWTLRLSDIRALVNVLADKARAVHAAPTLTSGGHCRFCTARGRCPALRDAVYNLIDAIDVPVAFDCMSGRDLAVEREILQRCATIVKARLEAIEDDLMHRVKNGDASCGLSLESVQGRLVWDVEPEQAITAVKMFGVDISRPSCDTPAQARAKIAPELRAAYDQAVKSITTRGSALKLVNSDATMAARVFKKPSGG